MEAKKLRLKEIFSSILNIEPELISYNSSSENLEQWDSLATINIAVALEQEYGIKVSMEDLINLRTYKQWEELVIKNILN